MDNRLYKQQMDRMRPIEHPEYSPLEDAKFTAIGLFVVAAPFILGALAIAIVAGLLGLFR